MEMNSNNLNHEDDRDFDHIAMEGDNPYRLDFAKYVVKSNAEDVRKTGPQRLPAGRYFARPSFYRASRSMNGKAKISVDFIIVSPGEYFGRFHRFQNYFVDSDGALRALDCLVQAATEGGYTGSLVDVARLQSLATGFVEIVLYDNGRHGTQIRYVNPIGDDIVDALHSHIAKNAKAQFESAYNRLKEMHEDTRQRDLRDRDARIWDETPW